MAILKDNEGQFVSIFPSVNLRLVKLFNELAPTVLSESEDALDGRNLQPFLIYGNQQGLSRALVLPTTDLANSQTFISERHPGCALMFLAGQRFDFSLRITGAQVNKLYEQMNCQEEQVVSDWLVCFPFPIGGFSIKKGKAKYVFENKYVDLEKAMFDNAKTVLSWAERKTVSGPEYIAGMTISNRPQRCDLFITQTEGMMATGGKIGNIRKLPFQREKIIGR